MGSRKNLTRDERLRSLDEEMAEKLREAEASGELRTAKSYGKPLDFGDGYDDTPAELRMGFKILRDANCAPPEVAMLNELAALRTQLAGLDPASEAAQAARKAIAELELKVSLRIERLASGKL